MKKIYKNDLLFILTIVIFVLFLLIFNRMNSHVLSNGIVEVKNKDNIYYFSLDNDNVYDLDLVSGHMTIEIYEHKVRVISSSCDNKDCIRIGSINTSGKDIICIPNEVIISIINGDEDEYDEVAY